MAIKAVDAAKIVDSGNYGSYDLDELYEALRLDSAAYGQQLSKLLQHIETTVKLDMNKLAGYAEAAEKLEELDSKTNPLDEKNADYKDLRAKLGDLAFYDEVDAKLKDKVLKSVFDNLVAVAKLEALTELRGAVSPESELAKRFRNSPNDIDRKAIYKEALEKNIDTAIFSMILGKEATKAYQTLMQECKTKAEADKKAKDFINGLDEDLQKRFDIFNNLGQIGAKKLDLDENSAVAYCAEAIVNTEYKLVEYKNNIKNLSKKISSTLAKFTSNSGKKLREDWDKAKVGVAKKFADCNKKLAEKTKSVGESCKIAWANRYEIARNVAKSIYAKRYEIGSDIAAASMFGLAVATGGTAAVVGGAVYAAYTVGRRVVYEAYKEKKASGKSYKEIYSSKKFIVKSGFAVLAAGISMGIAANASTAVDVGTQAATELASTIAIQKSLRRGTTVLGSVMSNAVGVATAKNQEERSKELKSLGLSVFGGTVSVLLGEYFSSNGNNVPSAKTENLSAGLNARLDSLGMRPDSLGMRPDSLGMRPDSLGMRPDSLGMRPDSLGMRPDSLGMRPDSLGMRPDSLGMRPDSLGMRPDSLGMRPDSLGMRPDSLGMRPDSTIVATNPNGELPNANTTIVETDVEIPSSFPTEYNESMGISKSQFINLRKIILKNGDEDMLNRLYMNAASNAKALSLDSNNPLTPEEILFGFTRAAAWTTNMDKDFWSFSATGAYGAELEAMKKLLNCDDKISVELIARCQKVLASIDEDGGVKGSYLRELCPGADNYNKFDANDKLIGTTSNRLVGLSADPCDKTKKAFQFAAGAAKPKTEEIPEEVVVPQERVKLDPLTAKPIAPVLNVPKPEIKLTPIQPIVPTEPLAEEANPSVRVGAGSHQSERPAAEAMNAMNSGKGTENMSGEMSRAAKRAIKAAGKSGKISDAASQALSDQLNNVR